MRAGGAQPLMPAAGQPGRRMRPGMMPRPRQPRVMMPATGGQMLRLGLVTARRSMMGGVLVVMAGGIGPGLAQRKHFKGQNRGRQPDPGRTFRGGGSATRHFKFPIPGLPQA